MKTRKSKTRKRGIWLIAAAVVIGGLLVIDSLAERRVEAAPVDLELNYFDGTRGSLSDFRGTPVVLNFWASWCPACVAEMPDFEAAHQHFGDEVVFIGMNMQEIDRAAAEALVAQTGVSYPLADDPNGNIYRRFGGIAMPTTVLITAEGTVATVHAGTLFGEHLLALIETELLS